MLLFFTCGICILYKRVKGRICLIDLCIRMKKPELIEVVMQAAGIEVKKQAITAVDAVFETITKVLAKGEEVAVPGFGTFRVTRRAAREGINPRTGEKIQIAAKIAPKFRAAKALKEAVM